MDVKQSGFCYFQWCIKSCCQVAICWQNIDTDPAFLGFCSVIHEKEILFLIISEENQGLQKDLVLDVPYMKIAVLTQYFPWLSLLL